MTTLQYSQRVIPDELYLIATEAGGRILRSIAHDALCRRCDLDDADIADQWIDHVIELGLLTQRGTWLHTAGPLNRRRRPFPSAALAFARMTLSGPWCSSTDSWDHTLRASTITVHLDLDPRRASLALRDAAVAWQPKDDPT